MYSIYQAGKAMTSDVALRPRSPKSRSRSNRFALGTALAEARSRDNFPERSNRIMSKKLLAAAVAALSLAACQETKTVTPAPPTPKVMVSESKPEPKPVAAVEVRDAGATQAEPTPVDVLALAHDAPGVDHLARAKQL